MDCLSFIQNKHLGCYLGYIIDLPLCCSRVSMVCRSNATPILPISLCLLTADSHRGTSQSHHPHALHLQHCQSTNRPWLVVPFFHPASSTINLSCYTLSSRVALMCLRAMPIRHIADWPRYCAPSSIFTPSGPPRYFVVVPLQCVPILATLHMPQASSVQVNLRGHYSIPAHLARQGYSVEGHNDDSWA